MCRLLFINKKINKDHIYKFLKQSTSIKYTPDNNGNIIDNPRDHNLHLDGFGFIWKQNNMIHMYKNPIRPQLDYNIKTIINIIDTNYIVGHLRATKNNICTPINFHSTHPFFWNEFYFCHNGCVDNFKNNKNIILEAINNKYVNNIKGCCDSEFLFYLFLSIFDTIEIKNLFDKLKESIKQFFTFINLLSGTVSANIIIVYRDITIITRYISNFNDKPPSLYKNKDYSIISSEPIDDNNILIDNNKVLYYNKVFIEEIDIIG